MRSRLLRQEGMVVWLTGLSGSGKSTLAAGLESALLKNGHFTYVLDGDIIRNGLNSDLDFSDGGRNENIRRVAEVAALMKDASIVVIVAFISPFRKMREFARQRAGYEDFAEVWVRAPLSVCIERDPKGLYKKALSNRITDFTGISSAYEDPPDPELIIDTDTLSVEESTDILTSFVMEKLKKH
ncbi:MAG TPA: adenylyl-sulfate kinase [Bacteroidales bacterium]|nr:adenylyl-sulfate kinase [Bacteroidales bacterium]HPJ60022.1 adenylyl-sulfate kinase [Bacteroidales bacterium]HRW85244.1 adenylyl-sulfate kinase [Bacteroidales bacterium]